jgi:hypothetical protein
MATFAELSADNPNLRQQYDEWREARTHKTVKTRPITKPSAST